MITTKQRTKRSKRRQQKQRRRPAIPFPFTFLLLLLAAIEVVRYELIASPRLHKHLRGYLSKESSIFIPPSLDAAHQRRLSINLGGGDCKWTPPEYDIDEGLDLQKTLIAGFPSGDKRMIFVQMEALTGFPAKDEWDFEYLGMSNEPFIKANYPQHEGIWGWEDAADQVVMMVKNIRGSMVEYHDILWDIGYAKTWEDATLNLGNLYSSAPPIEDFYAWRDTRVMDECHWYTWFIDYWMEGGLMRDIFTHKITTPEHWNMLMQPTVYSRDEVDYDRVVGPDTVVTPAYDPHCGDWGDVTQGCEPVAVISAEKLRNYTEGPAETAKIANVLHNDERTGRYVIADEAWDCIWAELIQRGKGLKTVAFRPGFVESDYNFSAEMLELMILELNRVVAKYSVAPWNTLETANRLVELLSWHLGLIQTELDETNSGLHTLTDRDFLGPKERRRRLQVANETNSVTGKNQKDRFQYFDLLHYEREKLRRVQKEARAEERKAERRAKRRAESQTERNLHRGRRTKSPNLIV